jgi:hypothetical protein
MMRIIIIRVLLCGVSIFGLKANDSIPDIEFKLIDIKKEKEYHFYIVTMTKVNNYNLDSLVALNLSKFNYHGIQFINLKCNEMNIIPKSYLFEDNVSGMLPYYKMVLGFEKKSTCKKEYLEIELNNNIYKVKIK